MHVETLNHDWLRRMRLEVQEQAYHCIISINICNTYMGALDYADDVAINA